MGGETAGEEERAALVSVPLEKEANESEASLCPREGLTFCSFTSGMGETGSPDRAASRAEARHEADDEEKERGEREGAAAEEVEADGEERRSDQACDCERAEESGVAVTTVTVGQIETGLGGP